MRSKKKRNINIPSKFMLHKAMTLAEVLITLGIIGVICAFTIPTLMNKTQDAELKSALTKEVSVLSQAVMKIMEDNGGTLDSVFGQEYTDNFLPFVNYLSIIKICNNNLSSEGCWHKDQNWYDYYGNSIVLEAQTFYSQNKGAILKDGSFIIAGAAGSPTCNSGAWISQEGSGSIGWQSGWPLDCGILMIDINGFKGPNRAGKDIFSISIRKNGIVFPGVYKLFNNRNAGLQCAGAVIRGEVCP